MHINKFNKIEIECILYFVQWSYPKITLNQINTKTTNL